MIETMKIGWVGEGDGRGMYSDDQQTVRPSVRPCTRTCSQRKKRVKNKLYLLEEVPPILGKVPGRKRHAKQNRSRNLPPTALPRIHREYQNVDHPTGIPISSLLFSFHASIIHSSFIIHHHSLIIPPNDNVR